MVFNKLFIQFRISEYFDQNQNLKNQSQIIAISKDGVKIVVKLLIFSFIKLILTAMTLSAKV